MDIRRLQYLEAVYRYKNFTRASEELFVTQPTISVGIRQLEEELGTKLIVRNAKETAFTEAGEEFMPYVRKILREYQAMNDTMHSLVSASGKILRLGFSPTLSGLLLPLIYTDFLPSRSNIQVHIEEGHMEAHIDKISRGILDASYNALPAREDPSKFRTIKITTAEIRAVMNANHPLARFRRIPFEALAGQRVVMLGKNAKIRQLMDIEFEKRGISYQLVSSHEQLTCMFNMVSLLNAIGFTNADAYSQNCSFTNLVLRPLEEPVYFDVGFIVRSDQRLPKITSDLIRYTQEHKASL